jgi:hypothetical protein
VDRGVSSCNTVWCSMWCKNTRRHAKTIMFDIILVLSTTSFSSFRSVTFPQLIPRCISCFIHPTYIYFFISLPPLFVQCNNRKQCETTKCFYEIYGSQGGVGLLSCNVVWTCRYQRTNVSEEHTVPIFSPKYLDSMSPPKSRYLSRRPHGVKT